MGISGTATVTPFASVTRHQPHDTVPERDLQLEADRIQHLEAQLCDGNELICISKFIDILKDGSLSHLAIGVNFVKDLKGNKKFSELCPQLMSNCAFATLVIQNSNIVSIQLHTKLITQLRTRALSIGEILTIDGKRLSNSFTIQPIEENYIDHVRNGLCRILS